MTEALATGLLPLILAYARIQACILAMPATGEGFLPGRVRIALAMSLTPLLASPSAAPLPAPLALAGLVAAEIASGLVLGWSVRLMAMALDMAATALAQAASLSQIMGVSPDMPPHPIGGVLHLAGLAVLMAMGLPQHLCRLLADSFALVPPGTLPQAGAVHDRLLPLVGDSFVLALVLASPFVLGGFLFQALSGIVARVMPALPISLITAPAAILATLAALAILTPQILETWALQVLAGMRP